MIKLILPKIYTTLIKCEERANYNMNKGLPLSHSRLYAKVTMQSTSPCSLPVKAFRKHFHKLKACVNVNIHEFKFTMKKAQNSFIYFEHLANCHLVQQLKYIP